MSTFALDTNSSSADIVGAVNYAIANLGQGIADATANVLVANVTNGQITTTSSNSSGYTNTTIVSYLYQYMDVKYANSATGGSGFSSNSANKSYYGLRNTTSGGTPSTNPVDYSWYQVTGGFGTTKGLYYQTIGGRQVAFFAGNAAPVASFIAVPDDTPLNLDTITAAQNNQAVITNAYYQANVTPATPSGGTYNFVTYTLTPPSGWSATIPGFVANNNVYVSTATFVGNTDNTAVPPNGTWSVPAIFTSQTSGNTGPAGSRGFVPMGYVITDSNPTGVSSSQYTTWFSSSRSNTTPPIGLGFTPIANDTAQFAYTDPFTQQTTTVVEQYNGTSWNPVVGNVISGGLFVPGSINANVLNANQVYAVTVQSTNANILNPASPGYWFQANTGNGRFGGNLSIGDYLTVGNDAQIGGNLNVGNTAKIGNDLLIGDTAIIGNSLRVGTDAQIGGNLNVGNGSTIGTNLTVGNNAVIGGNLTIGSNVGLGNNLTVGTNAVIGNNLTVGNNAVIGGNLQVSGLVTSGNLNSNTVSTTTMVLQAVSKGVGQSSGNNYTVVAPRTDNNTSSGIYYPYPYAEANVTGVNSTDTIYVNATWSGYVTTSNTATITVYGSLRRRDVYSGNVTSTLQKATYVFNTTGGNYYLNPSFTYIDTGLVSSNTYVYTTAFSVFGSPANNPSQLTSMTFYTGTVVAQTLKR